MPMNIMVRHFFLLLMISTLSFSQARGQAAILAMIFGDKVASENFYLSLEIGGNLADIPPFPRSKRLVAVNFGLGINIKLKDKWYIVPQFLPLQPKGYRYEGSLESGVFELDSLYSNVDIKRTISYIDVPLYLYYRPYRRWGIGVGPKIGFMTNASDYYESELANLEVFVKDEVNSVDFGIAIDIALELIAARKGKGLYLHFNYYQGFTQVQKFLPGQNSVIGISASFPFITDELAEDRLRNR
ncbi:outer membrane beta-barrel protein [Pontibacter sp. G13]|uniref:outer membrane beta-barrel protein n=1 Tax=Pontibacter sp. G13 TaxID=3074898 RepID=UPI002889E3C1|nr:outer membrane beta-barrel protein [Pontibacter sp. G13]WNJ20666.1 outer membrane beta-barrel protein [Pontibacter sp. G13]